MRRRHAQRRLRQHGRWREAAGGGGACVERPGRREHKRRWRGRCEHCGRVLIEVPRGLVCWSAARSAPVEAFLVFRAGFL